MNNKSINALLVLFRVAPKNAHNTASKFTVGSYVEFFLIIALITSIKNFWYKHIVTNHKMRKRISYLHFRNYYIS